MNKILKYIFIGTLTLGFVTSCSDDQLETSPTDRVSGSTMEGSADAAMIAMYLPFYVHRRLVNGR